MSTTTDANGHYEFNGLGDYILRKLPRAGWQRTVPAAGSYDLTLRAGDRLEGVDFGNRKTTNVFTVTNTDDNGPGSLRQAILDANRASDSHATVNFAIPLDDANFVDVDSVFPGGDPDADVFVIEPQNRLPQLTNPHGITIDGHSQADFVGNTNNLEPEIVLDGSSAKNADGLVLASDNNNVLGLNIRRFGGNGISIHASSRNIGTRKPYWHERDRNRRV